MEKPNDDEEEEEESLQYDVEPLIISIESSSSNTGVIGRYPEPPPERSGVAVTPSLIEWIGSNKIMTPKIKELGIQLITNRYEFGMEKYGQPLMTEDGRDTEEDALQELGDLIQYLFKAKLCGDKVEKVKDLIPLLLVLLQSMRDED